MPDLSFQILHNALALVKETQLQCTYFNSLYICLMFIIMFTAVHTYIEIKFHKLNILFYQCLVHQLGLILHNIFNNCHKVVYWNCTYFHLCYSAIIVDNTALKLPFHLLHSHTKFHFKFQSAIYTLKFSMQILISAMVKA